MFLITIHLKIRGLVTSCRLSLSHSLCEQQIIENTCTSRTSTISENGDEIVCHPIFGVVDRRGWALMKKGQEKAFVISKNKNND